MTEILATDLEDQTDFLSVKRTSPTFAYAAWVRRIIDEYAAEQQAKLMLAVQYTNDEYGIESRKLGLIKRAYSDDAGIDLPTVLSKDDQKHGITIYPGDRAMLHTGICVAFPPNHWGRIVHRSSTERRHRLRIVEGIIDMYRGPLIVQAHNGNSFPIVVQHGQRLAQLIIARSCCFQPYEVDELPPSDRGTQGFGSSGA